MASYEKSLVEDYIIEKLTEKGFTVYGYDKCVSTNNEALEKGFIKSNKLGCLSKADYIILSL